jgi:hypothetical protein
MMREEITGRLAERPYDERRKIPVPYFNEMDDGTVNYTGINASTVLKCGKENLCGICSQPLDYWIAFIGGPISLANRTYADPPLHEECALAAIKYCPHINRKVHRPTPDEKYDAATTWMAPQGDKPDEWIISITRSFQMVPFSGFVVFKTGTIARTLRFAYDESGHIQPVE